MSGWQNVLVSKCLGARISCSHNVWVSKRGVSKCPGVKMSGAEMSENRQQGQAGQAQASPAALPSSPRLPGECRGLVGTAGAHRWSEPAVGQVVSAAHAFRGIALTHNVCD